ncbi:5004_t:CDS:1 [Entrophospora sp. SA101]|nr:5004_t:CDS:1 [Entrophospora sp. SA101]
MEMANNIILNCIVILNNPRNQLSANIVSLIITIPSDGTVDDLQTAIQNQLESNISLDIRQICHPGPVDERRMRSPALISSFFNGDPPENVYHVVAYANSGT